jgi:transposase
MAHLIRDFCCFAERGGAGGEIGEQLLKRAAIMFRWWHRIRDGTLTRRTFQRRMSRWRGAASSARQRCAVTPRSRTWPRRS